MGFAIGTSVESMSCCGTKAESGAASLRTALVDEVVTPRNRVIPELGDRRTDTTGEVRFGLHVAVHTGLEGNHPRLRGRVHRRQHRQKNVFIAVLSVIAASLGDAVEE